MLLEFQVGSPLMTGWGWLPWPIPRRAQVAVATFPNSGVLKGQQVGDLIGNLYLPRIPLAEILTSPAVRFCRQMPTLPNPSFSPPYVLAMTTLLARSSPRGLSYNLYSFGESNYPGCSLHILGLKWPKDNLLGGHNGPIYQGQVKWQVVGLPLHWLSCHSHTEECIPPSWAHLGYIFQPYVLYNSLYDPSAQL